jgi:uncharacterized protein (DUF885 family)
MSQHHADARAALEAQLLAAAPSLPTTTAHALAADFIRWLDENGWAFYAVIPQRGTGSRADPEKVHGIVERFKAEQQQRAEGNLE